jgi:hypothetical protein
MAEFEDVLLTCDKWEELPGTYNRISAALPADLRSRMTEIMINYMMRFGPHGVFERMNNRHISQILAEYEASPTKVIDSGEKEGIQYHLYE